jgi:hypothetical protein
MDKNDALPTRIKFYRAHRLHLDEAPSQGIKVPPRSFAAVRNEAHEGLGGSIAVSAVPLSHVVETSRLAHHVKGMSRKEPKRSRGSDQNKAIARWDNEGGAPKGAPQEDRNELVSLTNEEEHILRCLGAAVIMQWNDLPTKIQRELFEHAISMGELNHTVELKGQVARFLHQHKDDGQE